MPWHIPGALFTTRFAGVKRRKDEATENYTRFLGSLLKQRVLHEFIIGHEPVREPGGGLYGVFAL